MSVTIPKLPDGYQWSAECVDELRPMFTMTLRKAGTQLAIQTDTRRPDGFWFRTITSRRLLVELRLWVGLDRLVKSWDRNVTAKRERRRYAQRTRSLEFVSQFMNGPQ